MPFNKIKYIDENVADNLKNLTIFDLRQNISIDTVYRFLQTSNKNATTMAQMKKDFRNKCKPIYVMCETLFSQEQEIERLKKENMELKEKLDGYLQTPITDLTIIINGNSFRINRNILIANSPYFQRWFRDNPDIDRLEITEISEPAFKEILHFMRTEEPPKDSKNFQEIHDVSIWLEMKELTEIVKAMMMIDLIVID